MGGASSRIPVGLNSAFRNRLHAAVEVGKFVALPPSWFDASDLGRPGLTREKDRVTHESRVVGYIVQLVATPGDGANKFLVAFGGPPNAPVQQHRTALELEAFVLAPADQARVSVKYFSLADEANSNDESTSASPRTEPETSPRQHPTPRASATESTLPQDANVQHRTEPGPQSTRCTSKKTSGAPPKEPRTLALADLQVFTAEWHDKVKEFTMLGYGGGEIKDSDGPIELHSSPWCKSVEVVLASVVAAMTTYAFCAPLSWATALLRLSSTTLQVRRRARRAADSVHSGMAQKARCEDEERSEVSSEWPRHAPPRHSVRCGVRGTAQLGAERVLPSCAEGGRPRPPQLVADSSVAGDRTLKSLIDLSVAVTDGAAIWRTIPELSQASNLAEAIRLLLAMPAHSEGREMAGALHTFR